MAETRYRIQVKDAEGKWRVALTVEQLAERHGLAAGSVWSQISRWGDAAASAIAGKLDGKKTVYWLRESDALFQARPGKGANLRTNRRPSG